MTSDVFIDSSILVEFIKGSKTQLLNSLIIQQQFVAYINETVVSEFLLYFLAVNGNAAPRTIKSAEKVAEIFEGYSNYTLIKHFAFLSNDENLFTLVPSFMAKYNLLPNDAIILATCKIHGITHLASHDADFILPCRQEGIELLTEQ